LIATNRDNIGCTIKRGIKYLRRYEHLYNAVYLLISRKSAINFAIRIPPVIIRKEVEKAQPAREIKRIALKSNAGTKKNVTPKESIFPP